MRLVAAILGLFLVVAAPLSAAVAAEEPLAAQPDSQDGDDVIELIYVLTCLQALTAGQTKVAEENCSEAISINPRDPDAYKLRGYAFLVDHLYPRAEMDFRAGLALRAKDHDMLAGLGQSLSGQGRFAEAITQLSQAARLAPGKAAYWNALCWARAGDGRRLDAALKDCDRALKLAPGAASPLNSRGLVKLKSRQFQAARADYDASLQARPSQSSARFGRGLARLWLADNGGVADIAMARQADPEIDDLFIRIGVLPADCGHPDKVSCPPAFPARPMQPSGDHLQTVSLVFGDGQDLFLAVEVGRLDAMVDQMALLLDRPSLMQHAQTAPEGPAEALARLDATTKRFNALLPAACYCAHIEKKLCSPYAMPRGAQSLHAALAAADGLFRHIHPVWRAVCRGHESKCQLE